MLPQLKYEETKLSKKKEINKELREFISDQINYNIEQIQDQMNSV